MATTYQDGSVHVWARDQFDDIIYNGSSASALGIVEAKVWPDGWGYILVEKTTETAAIKTLIDNQTLLHIMWGQVSIIGLQECET